MGVISLHNGGGSPRNSEQFRSATGTRRWVGGRLMVRQTDWEGNPVSGMRRREFITLLGGAAAAWPLAARAQQPAMPVIGFLGASTPSNWAAWTTAFVQGLRALGWVEGRTVKIEYRWAEGRSERYAEIAAEFVRLKVDVIVTVGSAVTAAKQATATLTIVFGGGNEHVEVVIVR